MRALFLFLLWLAVTAAVVLLPACYGHTCEGDIVKFGRNPGEGHLLSADEWETSALTEGWLEFPHQRSWDIDLHELGADRIPTLIIPSVSAQANPLKEGGNWTNAAGNLTTLLADRGHVYVHNDTCADYYLHLYVRAAPIAPFTPPTTDAGADAAP